MTRAAPPLLTRPVAVDDIPAAGLPLTVTPTQAERMALAAFNGLVALTTLTGTLLLRHEGRAGVHVTGEVTGLVTQTCVASLEPFEAQLSEEVDVHFLAPEALTAFRAARAKTVAPDDEPPEDEPDCIEHGRLDVGVLVAEHLTLGLDPYPRKPGAALVAGGVADDAPVSPFAVLRSRGEKRS